MIIYIQPSEYIPELVFRLIIHADKLMHKAADVFKASHSHIFK